MVGLGRRGLRNALAPRLVELELAFPTPAGGVRGLPHPASDRHASRGLPELASVAARMLDGVAVDMLA